MKVRDARGHASAENGRTCVFLQISQLHARVVKLVRNSIKITENNDYNCECSLKTTKQLRTHVDLRGLGSELLGGVQASLWGALGFKSGEGDLDTCFFS